MLSPYKKKIIFSAFSACPRDFCEGVSAVNLIYFQLKMSACFCGRDTVCESGSGAPHTPPRQLQLASIVLLLHDTAVYATVHTPLAEVGMKA